MFTAEQLTEHATGLSERADFRLAFAKMLQYVSGTPKFLSEEVVVKEYIKDYLRPELFFNEPTDEQVSSVYLEYTNTYGLDFVYELLPEYVKECLDPSKVIRELFRVYTEERNVFTRLIKQLASLQDPFEAPEDYLEYLAETIGLKLPYDLPEKSKRSLINRAVPWYKIKGTAQSFQIVFRSLGLGVDVIELWSNYEQTRFSSTPEQSPVIDGVDNPDYDPTDTSDGAIKYKTSFYELSMYPSAVSLSSNIISRALDKLEEVRPATRTLKQIKFSMNLTDDQDDGDGPGGDGGLGIGSGSGFPTPEDLFENDGSYTHEDFFDMESTEVLYGGDGQEVIMYGGSGVDYGNTGSRYNYDSDLSQISTPYYYNEGLVYYYNGVIYYDNAHNAIYDVVATGLTYAGLGSGVDELDIVNYVGVEDRVAGVKVQYDNENTSGSIDYSGSEALFTYGGSEVIDDLEISADILSDWDDTISSTDDADYVVSNTDNADQAYELLIYDGSVSYEGHTHDHSEDNLPVLDELSHTPRGELSDTVSVSEHLDVGLDFFDVVGTITDQTQEIAYINTSDEFTQTIYYNGLDIDGSSLTYGLGLISYGGRTYSDTLDIDGYDRNTSDSISFSDDLDYGYSFNESISASDAFTIYHAKESEDTYNSGLTYNGAIDYHSDFVDSSLVPFDSSTSPVGNWHVVVYYDGLSGVTYGESSPPSYGTVPLNFGDQTYGDFFSHGEMNNPFQDYLAVEDGEESSLEESVNMDDGVSSQAGSEFSESVTSTDFCSVVYSQDASDQFLSEYDFDGTKNTYGNNNSITYSDADVMYDAHMPNPESDAGYFDGSVIYYNGRLLKYDNTTIFYNGYAHNDTSIIIPVENDVVDYAEIEMIPVGSSSGTIIKI